jgi:hypothetical protein
MRCLAHTTASADFSPTCIAVSGPWTLRRGLPLAVIEEISRLPCELIPCVLGVSDRAGSECDSRCRHTRCCLPPNSTASAPQSARSLRCGVRFSRLNGQPACTPADASPSPLRMTAHGSGPVQFAILSLWDSFIPFNSPALTGALSLRTLLVTKPLT